MPIATSTESKSDANIGPSTENKGIAPEHTKSFLAAVEHARENGTLITSREELNSKIEDFKLEMRGTILSPSTMDIFLSTMARYDVPFDTLPAGKAQFIFEDPGTKEITETTIYASEAKGNVAYDEQRYTGDASGAINFTEKRTTVYSKEARAEIIEDIQDLKIDFNNDGVVNEEIIENSVNRGGQDQSIRNDRVVLSQTHIIDANDDGTPEFSHHSAVEKPRP